jgi:hypothetical protein
MQIIAIMNYHWTPVGTAKIQNIDKCCRRNEATGILLHDW